MGFIDNFLTSIYDSTIGLFTGGLQTLGDSLGITQHGRDQYFAREMQRDAIDSQIQAQERAQSRNFDFSREMYNTQLQDTLKHYPEFQKMAADAQFNLWLNQFNAQNAYNSPASQVNRMLAAGLNPSGGTQSVSTNNMGASSVSPPPIISGSPLGGHVSPVGIPQGLSSNGAELANIGSFIRDMAQARKTGKESSRFDEITDAMVEKLWQEASNHEALAAYNGVKAVIERALGKSAKSSEILKNLREGMYYGAREQTEKALKKLHDAETWLANTKNETLLEELPFVSSKIQSIIGYLDTGSQRNVADASLSYAKVITENDMRKLYRQETGYYEEIKRLAHLDNIERYATMPDRIRSSMQHAEQMGLISQKMYQEMDKLMRENDWIEVNQMLRMVSVGLEGYRIGRFADAFDARNAIEERFNDWRIEHYGDTEETYEESYVNNRGHKVKNTYSHKRAPR